MTEKVPQPRPAPGDPTTPGPAAESVTTAAPPTCPTRTRLYRDGELIKEGFPAEEISDHLDADREAVVWLDLDDPDEADLQIVIQEFGLHPLAVEDAIHEHQRPKLDRYRTHLFTNMYAAGFDGRTGELTTSEISGFITQRALITVRKNAFDVDTLVARWDDSRELACHGVTSSFTAYWTRSSTHITSRSSSSTTPSTTLRITFSEGDQTSTYGVAGSS